MQLRSEREGGGRGRRSAAAVLHQAHRGRPRPNPSSVRVMSAHYSDFIFNNRISHTVEVLFMTCCTLLFIFNHKSVFSYNV